MYPELRLLFDKNIAIAIDTYTELINSLFEQFKKDKSNVEWYIDEKNLSFHGIRVCPENSSDYFFIGMIYENWLHTSNPITIAVLVNDPIRNKEIRPILETVCKIVFGNEYEYININETPSVGIKLHYFIKKENESLLYKDIRQVYSALTLK